MRRDPILIVDDNPVSLRVAEVLLVKEGYSVKTANNAREALAVLAEFRPLLILMDVQLPEMDGFRFIQALKADPETQGITILALTAHAMNADGAEVLLAGGDGYMSRPINTKRLCELIADHMVDAHAEAEHTRNAWRPKLLREVRQLVSSQHE